VGYIGKPPEKEMGRRTWDIGHRTFEDLIHGSWHLDFSFLTGVEGRKMWQAGQVSAILSQEILDLYLSWDRDLICRVGRKIPT